MLLERGFKADTRRFIAGFSICAPEMRKRLRWRYKLKMGYSWRIDGTYVKVKGKWAYLYRTIDKQRDTIDSYLSPSHNKKTVKQFLNKSLRSIKSWAHPETINRDNQYRQGTGFLSHY